MRRFPRISLLIWNLCCGTFLIQSRRALECLVGPPPWTFLEPKYVLGLDIAMATISFFAYPYAHGVIVFYSQLSAADDKVRDLNAKFMYAEQCADDSSHLLQGPHNRLFVKHRYCLLFPISSYGGMCVVKKEIIN